MTEEANAGGEEATSEDNWEEEDAHTSTKRNSGIDQAKGKVKDSAESYQYRARHIPRGLNLGRGFRYSFLAREGGYKGRLGLQNRAPNA
jgi:hypothetical protein